jgi:Arc/MetJ family transcription regulator
MIGAPSGCCYDASVRTTITLDEDVAAQLRRVMRERDITFKDAIDTALRAGLGASREPRPYRLPTYRMGVRPG